MRTPLHATPMRVLLVEDNPADADLVREALRWDGEHAFELQHVSTLAEAVRTLGATEAEVVLLDLGLPDARGEETLDAVLSAAPTLPVVILTGLADDGSGTEAVRRGAQEFLSKSRLDDELLVRTIRHSVERHRLRLRSDELTRRLVASERLKSVGQLAAGVAHEISNPASFVSANSEALVDAAGVVRRAFSELCRRATSWPAAPRQHLEEVMLDGRIQDRIAEIEAVLRENRIGLDRIESIVRTLRAFSRTDGAEIRVTRVEDVVRDACTMVRPELRHRARLTLELACAPTIAADAGRLTQVVVNLLLNAAQAIGEGEPGDNEVRVRTRLADGWILVEVEDTGPGIPADVRDKVFDPFFTTKPREHGTGLGLPLSAEVVRHHGGELTFETTEGEGTCFTIRLPLENGLTLTSSPPRAAARQAGRARVLVVDDERFILRAFERLLKRDHEVHVVEGGAAAIALLQQGESYDAILCDLLMPGFDGREVYRWIADNRPELGEHLVFCSGGAVTEELEVFLTSTGVPVLPKPTSPQRLREVIAQLASVQAAVR